MNKYVVMNKPLVLERVIKKPVEKVWKALTDPTALAKWFFEIPDFEAKPGFQFKIIGNNEGVSYPSTCVIVEVKFEQLLSYTWSFDDYPGATTVILEVRASGNDTILKLTHEGLETLPEGHPHFELHNFITGWQYFIEKLAKVVSND